MMWEDFLWEALHARIGLPPPRRERLTPLTLRLQEHQAPSTRAAETAHGMSELLAIFDGSFSPVSPSFPDPYVFGRFLDDDSDSDWWSLDRFC
ncbi:hypothetical protein Vi05172_g3547 [Venturia inaequalis]|nr:hypothetical protein Vi05172_g3547 [Venturia inaequalis]